MKKATRLLLVAALMLVGMAISHASFAVNTGTMLNVGKAVADQTGLTQTATQTASQTATQAVTQKVTQKAGQLLNLNTASASQLTQLPGIGSKTAGAIIDKRTQLGGKFDSVDQLLSVKGIGAKKLEAIRPFLTL